MTEKPLIIPADDGGALGSDAPIEKPDLDAVMNGIEALKETIPEQVEQCSNCKFYMDSTSIAQKGKQGFCRRYPPTVFVLGVQQSKIVGQPPQTVTQSNFPPMAANGWCGDWKINYEQ